MPIRLHDIILADGSSDTGINTQDFCREFVYTGGKTTDKAISKLVSKNVPEDERTTLGAQDSEAKHPASAAVLLTRTGDQANPLYIMLPNLAHVLVRIQFSKPDLRNASRSPDLETLISYCLTSIEIQLPACPVHVGANILLVRIKKKHQEHVIRAVRYLEGLKNPCRAPQESPLLAPANVEVIASLVSTCICQLTAGFMPLLLATQIRKDTNSTNASKLGNAHF